MNVQPTKVHSRRIDRTHFHVNWGTYGGIANGIRIDKKRLRGRAASNGPRGVAGTFARARVSGHARANDAHTTRMTFPSRKRRIGRRGTADGTSYRRHDTASLITAMRGSVGHPEQRRQHGRSAKTRFH